LRTFHVTVVHGLHDHAEKSVGVPGTDSVNQINEFYEVFVTLAPQDDPLRQRPRGDACQDRGVLDEEALSQTRGELLELLRGRGHSRQLSRHR
jgi:hypothetical protein